MSLTKQTKVGQIEIVGQFKAVQVREDTVVLDNEVQIGQPSLHRYTILAGQDYSDQPDEVRAVCAAVHTPEVIAAYQASLSQSEPSPS